MPALLRLHLTDFRNFPAVEFAPRSVGFNLLYGLNGSGKTSLIEAIYYLSFGRSFRSHLASRIIRNNTEKFTIFAELSAHDGVRMPLGVERLLSGDLKIRIDGRDATSASELADLTPVQLMNSQGFTLLDAGPLYRRKYLDWGLFYQSRDFLPIWKAYGQVLRQRNAALRSGTSSPKELAVWTQELYLKGLSLDQYRRNYIAALLPELTQTAAALLDLPQLKMAYYPGWDDSQNYLQILENATAKDRLLGFTQYGPHRADLKITINKVTAKDILSRGQQKLFVCAMILAQGAMLKSANKSPIYLIDDLPAELDTISRNKLIALLSKQETQVFVTAVEREALDESLNGLPCTMFHVEHGCITELTPGKIEPICDLIVE